MEDFEDISEYDGLLNKIKSGNFTPLERYNIQMYCAMKGLGGLENIEKAINRNEIFIHVDGSN